MLIDMEIPKDFALVRLDIVRIARFNGKEQMLIYHLERRSACPD